MIVISEGSNDREGTSDGAGAEKLSDLLYGVHERHALGMLATAAERKSPECLNGCLIPHT